MSNKKFTNYCKFNSLLVTKKVRLSEYNHLLTFRWLNINTWQALELTGAIAQTLGETVKSPKKVRKNKHKYEINSYCYLEITDWDKIYQVRLTISSKIISFLKNHLNYQNLDVNVQSVFERLFQFSDDRTIESEKERISIETIEAIEKIQEENAIKAIDNKKKKQIGTVVVKKSVANNKKDSKYITANYYLKFMGRYTYLESQEIKLNRSYNAQSLTKRAKSEVDKFLKAYKNSLFSMGREKLLSIFPKIAMAESYQVKIYVVVLAGKNRVVNDPSKVKSPIFSTNLVRKYQNYALKSV